MVLFPGRLVTAAAVALSGAVVIAAATQPENASPVDSVELPTDYRQWEVISVAHEAGALGDIRVILGNDIAMKAFRTGRRPYPDGTAIARVAWKLEPSARNDAIFGKPQSFVAGDPTNVQIEVKHARRYAATGGWGYGQFVNGEVDSSAPPMNACFECHSKLPASEDSIFTSYSR